MSTTTYALFTEAQENLRKALCPFLCTPADKAAFNTALGHLLDKFNVRICYTLVRVHDNGCPEDYSTVIVGVFLSHEHARRAMEDAIKAEPKVVGSDYFDPISYRLEEEYLFA